LDEINWTTLCEFSRPLSGGMRKAGNNVRLPIVKTKETQRDTIFDGRQRAPTSKIKVSSNRT
jgi:hypothetical protein